MGGEDVDHMDLVVSKELAVVGVVALGLPLESPLDGQGLTSVTDGVETYPVVGEVPVGMQWRDLSCADDSNAELRHA